MGDGRRDRGPGRRHLGEERHPLFFGEMAVSPIIAATILVLLIGARPDSVLAAAPVLRAVGRGAGGGLVAEPTGSGAAQSAERGGSDPAAGIARKTWRYFETFMGPEDNGLPPDNFQEVQEPVVAHRTSPTNIAMGLLSTLAAHDFGYIRTRELIAKLEALLVRRKGWSGSRDICSTGTTPAPWPR